MKIVFITRDYPPTAGGVSGHSYYLGHTLSDRGHDVYIMTSIDQGGQKKMDGKVNIIPAIADWGLGGIPAIIKELEKVKPDQVLFQYVPNMYNRYGIPAAMAVLSLALRIKRFNQVTVFHEIAMRMTSGKLMHRFIAFIQRLIAYSIHLTSDISVTSIEFYRKMLSPFPDRVKKIPVGSNIQPCNIESAELSRLREKIAPDGSFIISTFGTNPPQRRNDALLEAVSSYALEEKKTDIKILFIGKFSDESRKVILESAQKLGLEESVFFTGYLEPSEVYKHLAISDIFYLFDVLNTDGLGGASIKSGSLAAAYSAGLPIISNKGDMTDDFFQDQNNIYLIDKVTPSEILRAVRTLIKNTGLRKELSLNAQWTYEIKLRWPVIAADFENIVNYSYMTHQGREKAETDFPACVENAEEQRYKIDPRV